MAKKRTTKKTAGKKSGEPAPVRQAGRVTFSGKPKATDAGGGSSSSSQTQQRAEFQRKTPDRPEHPRRVRGGIKLDAKAWPPDLNIFASPLIELVDQLVSPAVREEAFLDYAVRGQTRSIDVSPGAVEASIQGRRYKAYNVRVTFRTFEPAEWDRLIAATDREPLLPAKLLAGEMPIGALAFAEGEGLPLHPTPGDVARTTDSKESGDFDKHGACILMLLAEMVHRDPFLLFTLRGLRRDELSERLRQRRAVTSSSSGRAAAFVHQPLPEAEAAEAPLDAAIDRFYDAGPALRDLELPLRKPDVSHPLLRRLGPSPFEEGKFPLVGLLATCYDTISAAALRTPDDDADAAGVEAAEPADAAGESGRSSTTTPNASDEATEETARLGQQAPPRSELARTKPRAKAIPKAKAKAKKKS